jgi:hypothetical protein
MLLFSQIFLKKKLVATRSSTLRCSNQDFAKGERDEREGEGKKKKEKEKSEGKYPPTHHTCIKNFL